MDGAELVFEKEALEKIADKTIERKTGARGLRSIFEGVLTKIMYDLPSDSTVETVTITAETVDGGEPKIAHNPNHKHAPLTLPKENITRIE